MQVEEQSVERRAVDFLLRMNESTGRHLIALWVVVVVLFVLHVIDAQTDRTNELRIDNLQEQIRLISEADANSGSH